MPEPTEQEQAKTPEEQQSQDPRSAVEKILDRHVTKTEKPIEEQSKVEKEKSNEVQITPEALKEFEELGYNQADLEEFTGDELRNILKTQLKKEIKEVAPQVSIPVITEEIATTGFAKNLIGKPITELVSTVEQQNNYIQTLTNQIKELQKPQKTETKTIEEELGETDLVELEPKEQAKVILGLVNKAVKTALEANNQEWESKIEQRLQPLTKTAEREALKDLYERLQPKLPEGMKAEEVFHKWASNSGLSKEDKLALTQSEAALIEVISAYGKSMNEQISQERLDKEAKKKSKIVIYEEVKRRLKEADNTAVEGSQFNAANRNETIYRDEATNDTVRKIIARNSQ